LLVHFSFSLKIFFCHYGQLAALNFLSSLALLTRIRTQKAQPPEPEPFLKARCVGSALNAAVGEKRLESSGLWRLSPPILGHPHGRKAVKTVRFGPA